MTLQWDEEYQMAFDKVKEYLSNSLVFASPVLGKLFILYLTVHERLMVCVLGQHDETWCKEQAIYFLSKKFIKYESRYSPLEKMCCALAWIAQRLKQYMLYHTTWLITKLDLIKYIFEKPYLLGRIVRWKVFCQNLTSHMCLKRSLKDVQ